MSVEFFVSGVPAPQGSKKAFVQNGRAVLIDDDKPGLKVWRSAVRDAAERTRGFEGYSLEGPVRVEVVFQFVRPVSVRRALPSVKPDIDKLLRALFDGITASGLWKDDAQVVRVVAGKAYADRPGAVVRVGLMAGEEGKSA